MHCFLGGGSSIISSYAVFLFSTFFYLKQFQMYRKTAKTVTKKFQISFTEIYIIIIYATIVL